MFYEESLFDSLLTGWKVILHDLKGCESVKLLRWSGNFCNLDKVELHGFANAGLKCYNCWVYVSTAQKIKFSIKNLFSEWDQIGSFLRICSHLLKKSLMENFIFLWSVGFVGKMAFIMFHWYRLSHELLN